MALDFEAQRARMVERQLRRRGISDERVLEAMAAVPRERFVPESQLGHAYDDGALPIGQGQTISQPLIVASICEAMGLTGTERVLEVGTGSGYSTAVVARLAAEVISIEIYESLGERARAQLGELGVENVEVLVGDGSAGLPPRAPFAAISVHATAPKAPRPLLEQLEPGGRLVVPLAADGGDILTLFVRQGEEDFERSALAACRFVPLRGREGFAPVGGNGSAQTRP